MHGFNGTYKSVAHAQALRHHQINVLHWDHSVLDEKKEKFIWQLALYYTLGWQTMFLKVVFWSTNPKITASCLVVCPANKVQSTWLRGKTEVAPPLLFHLMSTKAAPTVLGFSYHLTQCPLNNGMVWQGEASVVVPGFEPTLHSDYLWLQIPVAWLCWNQSLDTERAVGDEFRRGTGWSLFISCTQQRGRYLGVARRRTGWGNREKRPFLYGNHQGQPLTFPAALLSSAGSLSKSHLNSERKHEWIWAANLVCGALSNFKCSSS